MAENKRGAFWKSNLELQHQKDGTESVISESGEDDTLIDEISVGPLMCRLFEKQLYTDIEFFSKDKKDSISAHRVVLAAKCDFFETLLFGHQANEAIGMKMQVEITNVPFGIFKDIVKYFYTDDIPFTDDSTALDIYATAQSFKIQSLIDQCEIHMETLELTEDNACSTLQLSSTKSAEILKTRCIDYIKTNTLKVISSPDFEKGSFTTIHEICDLQNLNLQSEAEMFEAIVRWINLQPKHAKEELKKSLLKCIRFLSFTPKEFHDVAKKYPNFLPHADALDLLMYLNDPTSKNIKDLPDWVNRSRRSFPQGIQGTCQNIKGRIKISLKAACEHQQITKLTSVLQMMCIKGSHKINAVKFSLEDVANRENEVAVLVIKTLVLPKRHQLCFTQTMDSKEAVFKFDRGIFVRSGQTFHLKVIIKTYQSCKFLQFDSSQNNFENEYFLCTISSRPKQGRFFFVEEVKYSPHVLRL